MDRTELTWNVYIGDSNAKTIKIHNVFNHGYFLECLKKAARKYKDTERDLFCEQMRKDLLYYYWSKCEWEVVIDHWPHWDKFNSEKVDVYSQVRMNWEPFCEYVWAHRAVLRRREKKGDKE
jgi:hypothetical protein